MQASGELLSQSGLVKHGLKLDMKDSIIRSFKKCGLWVALDGSENNEFNIDSLPKYKMSSAFVLVMNMYWMVTVNLKKKMKGNAYNEQELENLIHSDLTIVTEWY